MSEPGRTSLASPHGGQGRDAVEMALIVVLAVLLWGQAALVTVFVVQIIQAHDYAPTSTAPEPAS